MSWYDDEAFWQRMRPYMFSERKYVAAEAEVGSLVEWLGLEAGQRILDLPCGPGRHSIAFARRGFHVTAVDLSDSLLAEARSRADAAGQQIEWRTGDMRELDAEGEFDVAIHLFSSFGYFEDRADDRRVIANFARALRPGGRLVMEMLSLEFIARNFVERTWHHQDDDAMLLEERAMDWATGRISTTWTLVSDDGTQQTFAFDHTLYSAPHLRELLLSEGFADVRVHSGFDGAPFDPARRLTVVATR